MIKLISNQNITVTVEAGTDEMKEILYIIEVEYLFEVQ